jgi:hypothetical protein
MSTIFKASILGILSIAIGCAHVDTGNQQLQKDRVAQIKKGVTTRAELEQLFGPPTHVHMMGDGRRTMIYSGMHQDINASGEMVRAIPLVGGMIIPATHSSSRRLQQLQIILNKSEVVEDFEFSDTTTASHGDNSVVGGVHETETTTSNK